MAARLLTQSASDADIAGLRRMFTTFEDDKLHAKLDEYSEVNINFHQTIIELSGTGADPAGGEPVHPYAHDPRKHDRRR